MKGICQVNPENLVSPVEQIPQTKLHSCCQQERLARLQRKAERQHRSVEEVAIDLLNSILELEEGVPRLDAVITKVQETPPAPHNIRPAKGSLADALRNAPEDPDFDLDTWEREWTAVEAEMRAVTRADDIH